MQRNTMSVRARAGAFASALIAFLVVGAFAYAQSQPPQPPTPPAAKDGAKNPAKAPQNQPQNDAKDSAKMPAKDSAKDAKDSAKDAAKDTRDTAKDAARDVRESAKDTARDARDAAKDTGRDTRDQRVRDGSTPPVRDDRSRTGADARRPQDQRDQTARTRDDRTYDRQRDQNLQGSDRQRDQNLQGRDAGDARGTFRASDLRSADIGLWFDRSSRDGLVIADVGTKGAIAKIGFHEGDRIVSVNGRRVTREADFIQFLLGPDVRERRVQVIVIRDGQEQVIWVEPTVLIEEYRYVDNDPLEHFGIIIDDRYDDRIVVWRVIPQSPAYYAGIRAGDVLVTLRGRPLTTRQDFTQIVSNLDAGNIDVQVRRGERTRDLAVEVPRFQARSERRTVMRPSYDGDRIPERREARQETRQDNQKRTADRPSPLPRGR